MHRSHALCFKFTLMAAAAVATFWSPSVAKAFEAFDGRFQAHGYFESQLRFISADFNEQVDMSQWYQVLNVELELDIAPDGFGPFDLLQAYVRAEVRFDCIYVDGCGTWPSSGQARLPWGNDPGQLPPRLSNAKARLGYGQILRNESRTSSNGNRPSIVQYYTDQRFMPDRAVAPWSEMAVTRGLSRVPGSDGQTGRPRGYPYNGDMNPVPTGSGPGSATDRPRGRCQDNYIDCNWFAGGRDSISGGYFDTLATPGALFTSGDFTGTDCLGTPSGTDPSGCVTNTAYTTLASFQAKPRQVDGAVLDTDDPFPYFIKGMEDFTWTQIQVRGGSLNGLPFAILGPWSPHSIVRPNGYSASKVNPFDNFRDVTRSSCPEGRPNCGGFFVLNPVYVNPKEANNWNIRDTPTLSEDCRLVRGKPTDCTAADGVVPIGTGTPQSQAAAKWLYSPNGAPVTSPVLQSASFNSQMSNGFVTEYTPKIWNFLTCIVSGQNPVATGTQPNGANGRCLGFPRNAPFGPSGQVSIDLAAEMAYAQASRLGQIYAANPWFFEGLVPPGNQTALFDVGASSTGLRPLPFRRAGTTGGARSKAAGSWLPHKGLREAEINNYPFNCSESNRMWNRCDSQSQTKELKEAYLDIEMLDSQLWMRVGRQNIVWGKTELFRTTDQFNPVDLSLATLGSLEESRIPLWAFRGVYSLYEVGPLQDVRVELAFNYDEFMPADLGNCGEPYTVNIVCQITFGSALNSMFGIGVAGFNRPPDPWESIKGWEGGARVEWRWDKFSFVISDFYGFNDFPTVNRIVTYSRSVDPETGRPLKVGAVGGCAAPVDATSPQFADPGCLRVGPTTHLRLYNDLNQLNNPGFNTDTIIDRTSYFSENFVNNQPVLGYTPPLNRSISGGREYLYYTANDAHVANPNDPRTAYTNPKDPRYAGDMYRANQAVPGTFPTCNGTAGVTKNCIPALYNAMLDPNNPVSTGPGGYVSDYAYNEGNALDSHPLNQTVFAAICNGTVGFSRLDSTACAMTVFSSKRYLPSVPTPLSTILGRYFAGDTFISGAAGKAISGGPPPIVLLWRDSWTLNAPENRFGGTGGTPVNSRELADPQMGGCFNPRTLNTGVQPSPGAPLELTGPGRVCDYDDPTEGGYTYAERLNRGGTDPAHRTLNANLTPEQEALVGCGSYFGTNCDQDGLDFLWFEASAVLQSFVGIEGTRNLKGQGWRTDGLGDGEKVMVPEAALDFRFYCGNEIGSSVGNYEKCRLVKDTGSVFFEACGTITQCNAMPAASGVTRLIVTRENVGFFGLQAGCNTVDPVQYPGVRANCPTQQVDEIGLMFQGWRDNCSSWLGRVDNSRFDPTTGARNTNWNCVKRYGQPGTIGAQHIGTGDLTAVDPADPNSPLYVDTATDPDFQNFEINDAGPKCTTGDIGGRPGQILPGCRRKWANHQGDYLYFPGGSRRGNLNLFGIDAECQALEFPELDPRCTTRPDGTPLPTGHYLGVYQSERVDPRSWDVTKDGDPDFIGFDASELLYGTTGRGAYHPAMAYRTGSYAAGMEKIELTPGDPSSARYIQASCGPNAAYDSFTGFCVFSPTETGPGEQFAGSSDTTEFLQNTATHLQPGDNPGTFQPFFDPVGYAFNNSILNENACAPDQWSPLDRTGSVPPDALRALPQCARFRRTASGNFYGANPAQSVRALGTGHPFTGQPFASEMAALSWNIYTLLVANSTEFQDNKVPVAIPGINTTSPQKFPDEYRAPFGYSTFNPRDPRNANLLQEIQDLENPNLNPQDAATFELARKKRAELVGVCSFITPKKCGTPGAVMGLAGTTSRVTRAGGDGRYGRRTATWAAGGEITLGYDKRNVLGFGADFAEDYTKSNWGLEWTWIPDVATGDTASYDMISRVDQFNLTVSLDRPTFINFLNQNRTFFITTQWFFQYVDGFKKTMGPRGPFNVLGILFIQTGYFQDRLLPKLTLVYDVKSVSAAVITEFTYRYDDAFSISFGTAFFLGREFLTNQSVNPLGLGNRPLAGGDHPYSNSSPSGLGLVRDRDEVFFRLRYTF